jgi:predicted O-methyltransferase YrrM
MGMYKHVLHQIPLNKDNGNAGYPFWLNGWFSTLDAASLVCFLSMRKPSRYIEIGSGFSTMFARFAINSQGLATSLTSIDPQPRADIDKHCDNVVRTRLEDCDLSVFDQLTAGDILFFDGSHRVFTNSDVTVFFLEVLPRLSPGVLVHMHDIFLPFDYVPQWNARLYSEQYILAAMLICERPPFDVVMPNYFVCKDDDLVKHVKSMFAPTDGGHEIPMTYSNAAAVPGVSFWIQTVKGHRSL